MKNETPKTQIEIDPKFFTGLPGMKHNATFTVENPNGDYYTFKLRRPNGEAPMFVGLLTGPNNEADYTYLGLLVSFPEMTEKTTDAGTKLRVPTGRTLWTVKLTAKSRMNDNSKPVMVARWAIHHGTTDRQIPVGYKVHHEGKCGCCGRKLTVPESIERGIGPECWARMGGA